MDNWWIGSDNLISLAGLKDLSTGQYIDEAQVTGVLTDAAGAQVGPSIVLSHQAGSDGDYVGRLPHDAPLAEGVQYTLTLTAQGAGSVLVVKITRRAAWKGPS